MYKKKMYGGTIIIKFHFKFNDSFRHCVGLNRNKITSSDFRDRTDDCFLSIDTCNVLPYIRNMIQSFRHKGLKLFFESGNFSKVQPEHRKRLKLILTILHAASEIKDLNYPGSNLHRLTGEYKEFWTVNVSGNWRIIFRFEEGDVFDIDYLDYH